MKINKGSFATVPMAHLSGLAAQVQCLYMWLCKYANEDGNCFPSLGTLAKDCGLSESMVRRYMRELENLGLVGRESRADPGGRQTSNNYSVYDTPCMDARGEGGMDARGEGGMDARVYITKPIELKHKEKYSCEIFQKFWDLYPKKLDKDKTWTAWLQIPEDEKESVIHGLIQWNRYWSQTPKADHTFIIYPERFLKRKRYDNDAMEGELQPKLATLQTPLKLTKYQKAQSDAKNEAFKENMKTQEEQIAEQQKKDLESEKISDHMFRFFLSLPDSTRDEIEGLADQDLKQFTPHMIEKFPKIYEKTRRAKIFSIMNQKNITAPSPPLDVYVAGRESQ